MQPLSIRARTYIRDTDVRDGNSWMWQADFVRLGRLIIPLWVDIMVDPSGRRTEMGFYVGQMLAMEQLIITYVTVDPEPRIEEWGCIKGEVAIGQ